MAKSSGNSANNMYKEMQKMNNDTQIKLQQLTTQANKQTLDYNKQEAATARAWQKEMSETSHQMEVKDLIKAGLNPVLSANSGGAQSYSTSSASAQAESGANAMASLQGSYMSSYAGLKGTELSAAAQKQAAATAAAATRAAAAEAAAATRYAASLSYAQNKERIDFEKWKVKNEPQGNPFKILDRDLNLGLGNSKMKKFSDWLFGKNDSSKIKTYSDLNILGRSKVNSNLSSLGLKQTESNRNLYVSASKGNKSAIAKLNELYKFTNQRSQTKFKQTIASSVYGLPTNSYSARKQAGALERWKRR